MAANKQDAVEPNHRCNRAAAVTVLEDRYSTSQRVHPRRPEKQLRTCNRKMPWLPPNMPGLEVASCCSFSWKTRDVMNNIYPGLTCPCTLATDNAFYFLFWCGCYTFVSTLMAAALNLRHHFWLLKHSAYHFKWAHLQYFVSKMV